MKYKKMFPYFSRNTEFRCLACFLSVFLCTSSVNSFGANTTNVSISGNLVTTPPCKIHGTESEDSPVRIDFKEVAIQRIDGERYRQNVNLTITCEVSLGKNMVIALQYKGVRSDFDTSALQASQPGLGIRLYKDEDGKVIPPDSTLQLTFADTSRQDLFLFAIPVKDKGDSLVEGKFTASATLALNYP